MKNSNFNSYKEYVRLQVSKPKETKQKGLQWEYDVQRETKPEWVDRLFEFCPKNVDHILVLGARWGADVLYLQEGGFEGKITATDLHNPPLSELVIHGDAHDLSFLKEKVDVVWAYHVFEHFFKPSAVIDEILKHASDTLFISCVLPSFQSKDKYDAQDEFSDEHEFMKLFTNRGFEVVFYESKPAKANKLPAHYFIFRKTVDVND
jgi:hypothetical protein